MEIIKSKLQGNVLQEFTADYLEKHKDLIDFVKKETEDQLRLYSASNSCGFGDTSILIKGLEDISKWDDEQEEWYDDPGHCANMTLIKYYNSQK